MYVCVKRGEGRGREGVSEWGGEEEGVCRKGAGGDGRVSMCM